MARSLTCRELGMDCEFVARGETDDDVMRAGAEHAKRDHRMTDKQLSSPELHDRIRGLIHEA